MQFELWFHEAEARCDNALLSHIYMLLGKEEMSEWSYLSCTCIEKKEATTLARDFLKKRNIWLVLYILHEIGSENTRLQYVEMIKRKQLNTVSFFWTLVCFKTVLACTLFKHCKSYNAKQQLRIPYISIYRIICQ